MRNFSWGDDAPFCGLMIAVQYGKGSQDNAISFKSTGANRHHARLEFPAEDRVRLASGTLISARRRDVKRRVMQRL